MTVAQIMDRTTLLFAQSYHHDFKDRIRFVLRNPCDPSIRARYRGRMSFLKFLAADASLIRIEHWLSIETKAYMVACSYDRGNRLGLIVLDELRFLFRFLRRHPKKFEFWREAFLAEHEAVLEAAE